MATHNLSFTKSFIFVIEMGFLIVSCWRKMAFLCSSYLFTCFGCFHGYVIRLVSKKNSTCVIIQPQEDQIIDKGMVEHEKSDYLHHENYSFLTFSFPTYQEFIKNNREIINVERVDRIDNEVLTLKSDDLNDVTSCVNVKEIVRPQISSDCVRRIETNLVDVSVRPDGAIVSIENDINGENLDEMRQLVDVSKFVDQNVYVGDINSLQISEEVVVCRMEENIKEKKVDDDDDLRREFIKNAYYLSDDDDDESLVSDSDSDSLIPSTKSSFTSSFLDSISDGFLSDIDFERAFEELEMKPTKESLTEEDIELHNLMRGYEAEDFEDEDEDEEILKELKDIEESISEQENRTDLETVQDGEKPDSGEQLSSDSDEQNELERQWEHQDLVEQLKMEIRKVRAIGLPTILEESESPKIAEDLKPWKIDEKFQQEDTLDELLKFYKSYRERMRKLDILNYQKMYAIGFLRMKDPLQSFTGHKISNPALATLVSLKCWPLKLKSATKVQQQVMKKYSRDLESDLEMVYVGQMCLSWEFLNWEYSKALELWESDPHGMRHYNEVAEKFQQFQVLLTRFIEDEPFQGPRVQHYVKTRCVLRNLLQVPLIREDNLRDKKKGRIMVSSKDAITSVKLVETIEESIRVFWQFVRTDKDTSNALLMKCRRSSTIELQNPGDADLLAQVRSSLQKKEKKLKEMSKSENCILRKFRSHQGDNSGPILNFFSQVDVRLVQRVLNMSKVTTEQLVWCCDKLGRIKFSGRNLIIEPSVFLFPCS